LSARQAASFSTNQLNCDPSGRGRKPTMPSTRRNHRQAKTEPSPAAEVQELFEETNVKEMTHDLTEYLTRYARQNPGTAALTCMAIGFVLGWKLKPW
jgi:hypothetical protein